MKKFAFVLASGSGVRFESNSIPKHLTLIKNIPSIVWTIRNIIKSNLQPKIIVVIQPIYYEDTINCISKFFQLDKNNIIFAEGSKTRMESFFNRLNIILAKNYISDEDFLFLVDANRPLAPSSQYEELLESALISNCSCPIRGIVDGIAHIKENKIIAIPSKTEYAHFVTPEVINYAVLKKSLLKVKKDFNSLVEYALSINCIPSYIISSELNHKLTYKEDLTFFDQLIDKYNINF